jgi:protein-tyrosine phosphatase
MQVLFICTANYYRSRFAEAVFNHHARRRRMDWHAISRGLATYLVSEDISSSTVEALEDRRISRQHTAPTALQLTEVHLEDADVIIGLQEAEHRPIMDDLYPFWADKIIYWDIPDKPVIDPEVALPIVEEYVLELIDRLEAEPKLKK